jgi:holo-[acyl-carrier protein] synthase
MSPIDTPTSLTGAVWSATCDVMGPAHDLLGVDLVNMPDFDRQLRVVGTRLRERMFTIEERDFCGQDTQRLASTLAGKEAVAKVLGTGFRSGVRWTDVEILREPTGRPYTRLSGGAQRRASELGLRKLAISLCHEPPFAVAVAAGISAEATQ